MAALRFGSDLGVVWGVGYRYSQNRLNQRFEVSFSPDGRRLDVFNGFVQADCAIVPDILRGSIGTKLEHDNLSGFVMYDFIPLI